MKITHKQHFSKGWFTGLVLGLAASTALVYAAIPHTFTSGEIISAKDMNENFAELEARLTALETQLATVLELAPFLRVDTNVLNGMTGPHVIFEGVNVHIRSGAGTTDDGGALTGLGNLIIGYNEEPPGLAAGERAGSHNIVVGREHRYLNFGGLVAGFHNTVSGVEASVSGGNFNTASDFRASVSGGSGNTASGATASVSGGLRNTASEGQASVSGGIDNTANGVRASVSGGASNIASGDRASVSGGTGNTASGDVASVSGGTGNTASGFAASVSGGGGNTAGPNGQASVSGGFNCTVTSTNAWGVGDTTTTAGCPTTN